MQTTAVVLTTAIIHIASAAAAPSALAHATLTLQHDDDGATAREYSSSNATTSSACLAGRAVATFYMLGMQKCATTSFADLLLDAGGLTPPGVDSSCHVAEEVCGSAAGFAQAVATGLDPDRIKDTCERDMPCQHKEMRNLVTSLYGAVGDDDDMNGLSCPGFDCTTVDGSTARARAAFANNTHYACGDAPTNATLADFTPEYGRMLGLPRLLGQLYAGSVAKLSFVFMIREPMARTASSYDFMHYDERFTNFSSFVRWIRHAAPPTFPSLAANLSAWSQAEESADPFVRSLYGLLMEPWLTDSTGANPFGAHQFVVLPMRWATEHAREAVTLLQTRFGLDLHAERAPESAPRDNAGGGLPGASQIHSRVSDVNPSDVAWVNETFFEPDLAKLANVLIECMGRGGAVGGLPDGATDPDEVIAHLRSWW